ncbi:LOW QUALITY PROTEIN: zinc finger protein 800 [Osmia bicornis bicornis]|uniref:LOW QUALITY PROTEIN: zinc finger protein 800 n=1 Tax=Osmia bicornis bicornis TaxID=1437191 RepID=UPI0010F9E01B|nr:LOW QUALITY PROTEIN: zinc finger protein 800 [Osmia bicornis bicornis]
MQERRSYEIIRWMCDIYGKKSMKAKTKSKKPNGKFGKVKFPPTEVTTINPDLSQLSQPIDTSVSNLYRATKILESGSEEIKSILTYECDLVYECRICRSLFRSLVNFISHKRIYCKEKFDVTFTKNSFNDYTTAFTSESNNEKPEKLLQEVCGNDRILRSQVFKKEEKKDLTSVVNMLQKKQTENLRSNTEWICLETVQSNSSAVYQTVESIVSNQDHKDLMKAQVTELTDMISGQTAVLNSNGHLVQSIEESNSNSRTESSSAEGVSRTPEVCTICSARFSTKKTLAVHTKTLHTSHRLCFPCPFCTATFANTWSVYRHLFKTHRKTSEEVRKLRSQIQEKAYMKDTTVAEDLQKEDANKTLTNDALRINETQEWMDHLESDAELQRCGGCGKRFDRKAALSAHSQYCHRRVAACESTNKVKRANKISPDPIPKENIIINSEIQKNLNAENCSISAEINHSNETPIRVESVATLSKEDWEMLDTGKLSSRNEPSKEIAAVYTNGVEKTTEKINVPSTSDISDPIEIVYTNINKPKISVGSRKRKGKDSPKRLSNSPANVTRNISLDINTEQAAEMKNVDNVLLMEEKVASIINLPKLQCLKCKRKFMSATNLRRHAAIHIGWNRYRCKLCNFKCFVKCDCVAHCNKMHNAQNNRVIIEDMIGLIPENQSIRDQTIMVDITNLEKESSTPEVIEERVESEVQVEEKTKEKEKEEDKKKLNTDSTMHQEIVHINGESQQEASTINTKEQNNLLDPDVRKMVMEVIFGPPEMDSTKQVDKKEELESIKDNETAQSSCSDLKEGDNMSMQNHSKPQRPIRNKIKPLNKDFIYDLKDVTFRKDSLLIKPFSKTLGKKPLVPDEDGLDRDVEQASKRFKSIQNAKISILCENTVIDKCDIKLKEDVKNSLTFPQCHS